MAPITNTGLDWSVAKEVLTHADLERLACAFLNTESVHNFNAVTAAEQFGGGGKPESFKRGVWVITKKINDAMGGDGGRKGMKRRRSDGEVNSKQTKKAKVGKKGAKSEALVKLREENCKS